MTTPHRCEESISDADITAAAQRLLDAERRTRAKRIVADWPPLTSEQRRVVVDLLRPVERP